MVCAQTRSLPSRAAMTLTITANRAAIVTTLLHGGPRRFGAAHPQLQPAHQQQDDDDQKDDAEDAARPVTPAPAVRPARDRADQQQNEDDQKNSTE